MNAPPASSRREFLKLVSTGTMAGVALITTTAQAQNAVTPSPAPEIAPPQASDRPELLVVSQLGSRHPLLRSFLCQLLERGIHFHHDDQQQVPAALLEDWPSYRAIVFDSPAYKTALGQPELAGKLAGYLVDQGVLFHLIDPADGAKVGNAVYDVEMAETAGIVIMHAGLTEQHPALAARQAARPDETIIAELRNDILQRVEKLREWGEFNNHCWRPAMLLAEEGDAHARELLLASIRESCAAMPTGFLGQSLACGAPLGSFGRPASANRSTRRSPCSTASYRSVRAPWAC